MPNGGISIDDYLKYLEQPSARNLGDDQTAVGQQISAAPGDWAAEYLSLIHISEPTRPY